MASTAMQPYVPQNLDELYSLCDRLAKSDLMPEALRGKPANCAIVLMTGQELGLGPMLAARTINVIKGKPTLAADLMSALVQRSSVCEYFQCVETTATQAVFETRRRGAPRPVRFSWTMKMAQTAGLTNQPNWKSYPESMLRARCQAALARAVYPDIVAGIYDPDELADTVTPPANIIDATVVEPVPPAEEVDQRPQDEILGAFIAALNNAQTVADLNDVAKRIKDAGISDEGREQLKAQFKARRDALIKAAEPVAPNGEVAA